MAHVQLDNIVMPEARKLKFKGSVQVLAAALSGDPLYVGYRSPARKSAGPDGQPGPGRPAAADGVPDHGDQRPGVVLGYPRRAARIDRGRRGNRGRSPVEGSCPRTPRYCCAGRTAPTKCFRAAWAA